jgi:hypothetical protein
MRKNNSNFTFKLLTKVILPDILFLIFALISWILTCEISHNIPGYYFYFLYILLYTAAILSIYNKLYIWRNLPISFKSFIFFFLNATQFILYAWSFYLLIFFKFPKPIYLEDLSIISQYRYLVLFVAFCISIIIYFIAYFFNNQFPLNISLFTYPYLKEEIRIILYTWHHIFSQLFSKFLHYLYTATHFMRICYLLIHFLFFYIPRILISIIFFYCIFFNGDFCYLFYFSPVLFIVWVASFFDYYFNIFFKESFIYVKLLLNVKLNAYNKVSENIIQSSAKNMTFTLTDEAYQRGYTDLGKLGLIEVWEICAVLSVYFKIYFRILSIISYILLTLQFINLLGIIYLLIFKTLSNHVFFTWPLFTFTSCKNLGRSITRLCVPYYPNLNDHRRSYEAAWVDKMFKKQLESATEGIQKGSHPAIIDRTEKNPDNPGEVRYLGEATHAKTLPNGKCTEVLHPSTDLQGKSRPQNFLPAETVQFYDAIAFKDIPGSKQFLESDPALANIIKHKAQPEDT